MRYFHQLRLNTKQKLESKCRKTTLEIVQDFPENVEKLATLLQIKNKEAKRILRYEKLPTKEQAEKMEEYLNEIRLR